jgi:hypothetical protein
VPGARTGSQRPGEMDNTLRLTIMREMNSAEGGRRCRSQWVRDSTGVEHAPLLGSQTFATLKVSSIRAFRYPVVLSMSFFSPLPVCQP